MNKKIICIGIVCMFLLTGLTAVSADQINTKSINVDTNNIEQLEFILEKIKEKNPALYTIVKQTLDNAIDRIVSGSTTINAPPDKGIYEFSPCDAIEIDCKGYYEEDISEGTSLLFLFVTEGQVNLDNSYSNEFISDELWAAVIFVNFTGDLSPEDPPNLYAPPVPITVDGSAEHGILVEISLLVNANSKKNEYKQGESVTVNIQNIHLTKEIKLKNPHIYVVNNDEELVYEKVIENPWTLSPREKVSWYWDQKDTDGNQVPKGHYRVFGEFQINENTHWVFTGFNIKEKKDRFANQQFIQVLENLMQRFPLLEQLVSRLLLQDC